MIEIRREDFSIDEVVHRMKRPQIGAILTYLGTVREFPSGSGLEFDDDGDALRNLEEIEKRALNEFDIEDVAIIHRFGFLSISENILFIVVSASRREPAFAACKRIIDDIKELHSSWKREVRK
jgi:molybdopterin synthase catalytic subunit